MRHYRFGMVKSAGTKILALALMVVLIAPAALADSRDVVDGWVEDSRDSDIVKVSYGAISESGTADAVTVTDLTIDILLGGVADYFVNAFGIEPNEDTAAAQNMRYTIVFPQISFEELAETEGHFTAASVTSPLVEIAMEGLPDQETVSQQRGIEIANLRFAKLPAIDEDPARPVSRFVPLIRAMLDWSFDTMVMERLETTTITMAAGEGETVEIRQAYGPMTVGETISGNFGEMTVLDFTNEIYANGASEPEVMLTIDEMVATDYNYTGFVEAFVSNELSDDDTPYTSVSRRMAVNGTNVMVREGDVTVDIAEILLEDFGVRPPAIDTLGRIDTWIVEGLDNPGFEPDELQIVELVGAIYGQMRIGGAEMSGIAGSGADFDGFELASYGLEDLSSAGLGAAYLNGLDIRGPGGEEIAIGRYAIEGVVFPELVALMNLEEAMEAQDTETVLRAIPIIEKITQDDVTLVLPEEDFDFFLGASTLAFGDHIGPVPTSVLLSLQDLRLPTSQMDDEQKALFAGLGYDVVEGSIEINANWNAQSNDISVNLDGELVDGGELSGRAVLGNIPEIIFRQPDQSAVFALLGATFKQLELEFGDNSIVDRALEFAGAQQGQDYEAMKAQLLGIAPVMLGQLGDPQLAAEAAQALTNLVNNGGRITLDVAAPTPLPIAAMGPSLQSNPAAVLESLDVEVGN